MGIKGEKKRSKWEGAEMGTIGDKRYGNRDKRHWAEEKEARGARQGTRDKRHGEGARDWARGKGQEA
jgi:hypothetical protein